jgi:hypothetical protein
LPRQRCTQIHFPDSELIPGTSEEEVMSLHLRTWLSAIFLLLPMQWTICVAESRPSLSLDQITLGSSEHVKFVPHDGDTVARDSRPFKVEFTTATADGHYEILMDPDSMVYNPKCDCFTFDLVVRTANAVDPAWTYAVSAFPVGRFADTRAPITVKLQNGSNPPATAEVEIPLHSSEYADAVQVIEAADQPFLPVSLATAQAPTVHLKNQLAKFAIHITGLQLYPQCDQCWSTAATFTSIDIPAQGDILLSLNRKPLDIPALLNTAFILKRTSPHDVVLMKVFYNVDEGGVSKEKDLNLPIRFTPSIWQLLLAILSGALFGTVLRWRLDPAHSRISMNLVLQSILFAGVAELVAVVLASYDSRLVLLGVDMDPRQFIPAIVLAGLVAGGPVVAKWLASIPGLSKPGTGGRAGNGGGDGGGGNRAHHEEPKAAHADAAANPETPVGGGH